MLQGENKMKQNESVYKIMSTDITSCRPIDKFSHIKSLMDSSCARHLPVLEGSKLVGIISRLDVLKVEFSSAFNTSDNDNCNMMLDSKVDARSIMTKEIITLNENDTIKTAAKIFASHSFHSLPVVNSNGDLMGMISTTDIIQYLLDQY